MEMMVERKFPPLTPHHTQAFTVLMMQQFFGKYLKDPSVQAKSKLKVKTFINC